MRHRIARPSLIALMLGLGACATVVAPTHHAVKEAAPLQVLQCNLLKTISATSPFYGVFAGLALQSIKEMLLNEAAEIGATHIVFGQSEVVYGSTTQHAQAYFCPTPDTRPEKSIAGKGEQLEGPIEDLAKQLSSGIKTHHIIRIAVLPLSDASHEVNRPLGNYLTEKLTTALYKIGSAKVVERSQLDKVIEELHLTMSGRFDEASVQRIGKLLGVDAVIVGSYTELGTHTVEVNSRVIHVETGEIVGVGTVQIPTGAVEPLLR